MLDVELVLVCGAAHLYSQQVMWLLCMLVI